jgi:hypothetical protein
LNRLNEFKIKKDYEYRVLEIITLKTSTISFNFKSTKIKFKSLNKYFKDIPNFFNDKLPSTEYFDLENIIIKYGMLNPKKAFDVVIKWKKNLEDIQVYLGNIESQITDGQQLTNKILQLFGVQNVSEKFN